jgi:hypothetical protein
MLKMSVDISMSMAWRADFESENTTISFGVILPFSESTLILHRVSS